MMEQSNSGGKNFQVKAQRVNHIGDVHHYGGGPSAEDLLDRGKQLLQHGAYAQAKEVLAESLSANPLVAQAHYNYAIASLQGKRPKSLNRAEVEAIDSAISSALSLEPRNGTFHLFRALVRHDYYEVNGLKSPSPSPADIVERRGFHNTNITELKHLFNQLSAFRNNPLYAALNSQMR